MVGRLWQRLQLWLEAPRQRVLVGADLVSVSPSVEEESTEQGQCGHCCQPKQGGASVMRES